MIADDVINIARSMSNDINELDELSSYISDNINGCYSKKFIMKSTVITTKLHGFYSLNLFNNKQYIVDLKKTIHSFKEMIDKRNLIASDDISDNLRICLLDEVITDLIPKMNKLCRELSHNIYA